MFPVRIVTALVAGGGANDRFSVEPLGSEIDSQIRSVLPGSPRSSTYITNEYPPAPVCPDGPYFPMPVSSAKAAPVRSEPTARPVSFVALSRRFWPLAPWIVTSRLPASRPLVWYLATKLKSVLALLAGQLKLPPPVMKPAPDTEVVTTLWPVPA